MSKSAPVQLDFLLERQSWTVDTSEAAEPKQKNTKPAAKENTTVKKATPVKAKNMNFISVNKC